MNTLEKLCHDYLLPAWYAEVMQKGLTYELFLDIQLWDIRKRIQGCWLLQELPRIR